MREERPYQLALVCGADEEKVALVAESVVNLTPETPDADAVLARLDASGLKPADLRARAILIVDGKLDAALAVYAAATGFAGRRLDVATPTGVVHIDKVHGTGRKVVDAGRPDERPEVIEISTESDADIQLAGANPFDSIDAPAATSIRYAKRVRITAPDDMTGAFVLFAAVAGLRCRRDQERYPIMVTDGVEVDLDQLRQAAGARRRSLRGYVADVLCDPVALTARQVRLSEAASVDISDVLARLGCQTDGELWQCPRPGKHTHGDATPSMKVTDNKVRCFVDDAEWIDALRLVMGACTLTPDEAANFILDGSDEAWQAQRVVIDAARAAKASAA